MVQLRDDSKKERVTNFDYCQYPLLNCSSDVSCVSHIKKYSPYLARVSDTLKVNVGVSFTAVCVSGSGAGVDSPLKWDTA